MALIDTDKNGLGAGSHKGSLGKIFYENLDYCDAVAYAILDFKKHGHEYYNDFIKN
jgi:hypothetical protein